MQDNSEEDDHYNESSNRGPNPNFNSSAPNASEGTHTNNNQHRERVLQSSHNTHDNAANSNADRHTYNQVNPEERFEDAQVDHEQE